MRAIYVADTNMLVFKKPHGPNANFNGPNANPYRPNTTPNASRHGRFRARVGASVGSRVGAHVGHVDFMLLVSISFVMGSQCERGFWWNMGLCVSLYSTRVAFRVALGHIWGYEYCIHVTLPLLLHLFV